MNEPIKVGDLVAVVHQCCDTDSELGEIFSVTRMRGPLLMTCSHCKWSAVTVGAIGGHASNLPWFGGVPVHWLKRIPPLDELDDVKREEEITA